MHLPAVLGKYELVERLASGGMADVYLARARGPAGVQKTVVVKRIREEFADDPRFVSLFIQEARIGVDLQHPNIVQVFELGRAQGTWFIAMEFVHGRDLTQVLRRLRGLQRRLPDGFSVHLVSELLRGLHYAHSRTHPDGTPCGWVHRDVSPHNVILGFDGELKLVDFGIAGEATGADTPAARGKFAYASPEGLQGGGLDVRSDLYSAGVVLWELLTGERPHRGLEVSERLERLVQVGVPDPRTLRPDLDPLLAEIVMRAVARDPAERPSDAAVLEEDLRTWSYRQAARATPRAIGALVQELFPDAQRPESGARVHDLVRDLSLLEAPHTLNVPRRLLGRLQLSPGERKQVAVLVLDVDGLTDLSATLEPERFFRRKFRLLRFVHRIVEAWGGVLQRAIDDHFFVLFGVPRTREDDLSRAMDCALELARRGPELVGRGLTLQFCMGLHAGEVSVQTRRQRVQYLARGDTTRLARRLSATADHGEILVSERVVSTMAVDFRLRQGPAIVSRGGREPSVSYRLEGRREGVRLATGGQWLRRGEEIEQLRRAVERLAEGHGTALAVIGPVGAGKSRLIQEVQQLATRRELPFHIVRRARRESENPFRPLVLTLFGLTESSTMAEVERQLERGVELGLSATVIQSLGWVAGLPNPPPDTAQWVQALESLLRSVADGDAAVLALEIEGIPEASLHILAHLLGRLANTPLLTMLVARPPLSPLLQPVVLEVVLRPVDRFAQARMLRSVLDVQAVSPELLDLVASNCEGNPLYLKEMVKVLLDRGHLRVDDGMALLAPDAVVGLPDSLHGLIAARIDALDAACKGILQLASVCGMHFSAALLARASGLDDPSPLLLELEAVGLVERNGRAWSFVTGLVREAASRGILGVQRRSYHRMVSEAIEATYADRLEPWYDELSQHCAQGGRFVEAARYAHRTAADLEAKGRLDEARVRIARGLRWLASATDPGDHDARVQGEAALHLQAGSICLLLGETGVAMRSLTLALDIAGDASLPWIELRAHLALGRRHLADGRHALAAAHLSTARELATTEADPQRELEVLECLAGLALDQGDTARAEQLWQEVIERSADDPALSARAQSGLATRWLRAGQTERAGPMLESALSAARSIGDRILEGRVLNNIGLLHSLQDNHDAALDHYRRALSVREGIGYTRGMVINHHNIGDVHFQRGDHTRAQMAFSRSRELAAATDDERGIVLNDVFLIYLQVRAGQAPREALEEVRVRALAVGDPHTAVTARWLLGRHLATNSEDDEARRVLARALEEADEHGLASVRRLVERSQAEHSLGEHVRQ